MTPMEFHWNSDGMVERFFSAIQKLFSESDDSKFPPFMKLFWQEQQKYINSSSSTGIRYHSMIIKFSLNLAAKLSSAYKDLHYDSGTRSGLLVLLSLRLLCDYKNYIKPTRRFNPDVINDLGKKTRGESRINFRVLQNLQKK